MRLPLPAHYVDPAAWPSRQAMAWREESGLSIHQRDARDPAARATLGAAGLTATRPLPAWGEDALSALDRGDLMVFLRNHEARLEGT